MGTAGAVRGRRKFVVAEVWIPCLALVFYAPFVPRFFDGDDWLWLEQARQAWGDPTLFFERGVYGYFRPVFVFHVGMLQRLFGLRGLAFGAANVLLHAANCWLLLRLLRALGYEPRTRAAAGIFFAVYLLATPAVCYLSAGADVLVVTLCLLFAKVLLEYAREFSWRRWASLLLLGLLAAWSKETGFASLLLFLGYFLVSGGNPFRRSHRNGTLLLLLAFVAMLVADRLGSSRKPSLGIGTLENLWYLLVQLLLPIPQRFAEDLPGSALRFLTLLRGFVTLLVPVGWVWACAKTRPEGRLLLIWPVAFLVPVALLPWDIGLFRLYPEATASRYLYAPLPGLAILVGILVSKRVRGRLASFLVLGCFLTLNGLADAFISRAYRHGQDASRSVFEALQRKSGELEGCGSATVRCDSFALASEIHCNTAVLAAMTYLILDKELVFETDATVAASPCSLLWRQVPAGSGTAVRLEVAAPDKKRPPPK